jgi:aspartyl/glutamyl-tRNA(Asn/Gln) amidotransferase C subunit
MTQKVDIAALAKLARLDVSAEEMARLEKEFPAILGFVETIQKVATDAEEHDASLRNVMRDDANPHESGKYTNDLLAAAPTVKDNQVVVKQVISKKK